MYKFILTNENGRDVSIIRQKTKNTRCLDGILTGITSWGSNYDIHDEDFVADFFIKWDGCSHYWFLGQDYNDKDSYYHICGSNSYILFMAMLWFAYESSKIWIEELNDGRMNDDFDCSNLNFSNYTIRYEKMTDCDYAKIKEYSDED